MLMVVSVGLARRGESIVCFVAVAFNERKSLAAQRIQRSQIAMVANITASTAHVRAAASKRLALAARHAATATNPNPNHGNNTSGSITPDGDANPARRHSGELAYTRTLIEPRNLHPPPNSLTAA